MSYFCQVGIAFQIPLLVVSLLTVTLLIGSSVLLHKHKYKSSYFTAALTVLNASLYVMMQTDSTITGNEHSLHLPYALVCIVTALSLGVAVNALLYGTKRRDTLDNSSIKEAFDNLPTGVCFFNESGLPVLSNREINRFSFAVCGKDVQFITDLDEMLSDDFQPSDGAVKNGKVFTASNGKSWQLEKRTVTDDGGSYTQFTAFDVTDLQNNRVELTEETEQLRRAQAELKKLSANVVTITREEEILNTKMRVHDEMGRCLVEAQKYLSDTGESIPDSIVNSWQRAVSMLKYNNETSDDDMMLQIQKTCESLKLGFNKTGSLPKDEVSAYILTCAVRECVTNAVRYAQASELYADFADDGTSSCVTVTNNGKQPEHTIKEGGGLSTLRRRIERAGGTMTVISQPQFKLTVTVPKVKQEVL